MGFDVGAPEAYGTLPGLDLVGATSTPYSDPVLPIFRSPCRILDFESKRWILHQIFLLLQSIRQGTKEGGVVEYVEQTLSPSIPQTPPLSHTNTIDI